MKENELSHPVHWRGRQWAITGYGLESAQLKQKEAKMTAKPPTRRAVEASDFDRRDTAELTKLIRKVFSQQAKIMAEQTKIATWRAEIEAKVDTILAQT